MSNSEFKDHQTSCSGKEDLSFCPYQVSWKSARRFRKRRFLKGFTIYERGGHLVHVTSIMSSDFYFLVAESFHKIFALDRQTSF